VFDRSVGLQVGDTARALHGLSPIVSGILERLDSKGWVRVLLEIVGRHVVPLLLSRHSDWRSPVLLMVG
jgi:hypothetical protein